MLSYPWDQQNQVHFVKKNKNRINISHNLLFEKLFYKLVDGTDNIYFEYFFLN